MPSFTHSHLLSLSFIVCFSLSEVKGNYFNCYYDCNVQANFSLEIFKTVQKVTQLSHVLIYIRASFQTKMEGNGSKCFRENGVYGE